MQRNIDLTARELMDKWEMDPIDLYHQIKDGLPAYFNGHRIHIDWLNPLGPDFEKRLSLLRFWKRHVELWEVGGAEALAEGTRLRYPSMGDSSKPQLDGFTSPFKKLRPDPMPVKQERKVRYHKEKKNLIALYERFIKHDDPRKGIRWFYDNRVLSKDGKHHKVHHPGKPRKPFTYKRICEWIRLHKKGELF